MSAGTQNFVARGRSLLPPVADRKDCFAVEEVAEPLLAAAEPEAELERRNHLELRGPAELAPAKQMADCCLQIAVVVVAVAVAEGHRFRHRQHF